MLHEREINLHCAKRTGGCLLHQLAYYNTCTLKTHGTLSRLQKNSAAAKTQYCRRDAARPVGRPNVPSQKHPSVSVSYSTVAGVQRGLAGLSGLLAGARSAGTWSSVLCGWLHISRRGGTDVEASSQILHSSDITEC